MVPRVHAEVRREPAALSGEDAEDEVVVVARVVDIAVDRDLASRFHGGADVRIAEVEAHPVGVDLQRHIVLDRGGDEFVHVGFESRSALDESSCWVSDDVDAWVLDRFEQSLGRLLGFGAESGVG